MKASDLGRLLGIDDLQTQVEVVNRALEAAVASDNAYLREPGHRVVTAGGKRLRPVLTIASAHSGGVSLNDDVRNGAVAVELVHAGSLVHDDILDGAEARRGVATVNDQEGSSHAILVGDFLLARAGEAAAAVSREVAAELARTLGALCDGQSREVVDAYDVSRTVDSYLASIIGKTAALMRSACTIGALSARLPDATTVTLAAFGEAFGVAFQIVDDVLDIVSTRELLGKPVGNDVREGVYTLPVLYALQGPRGDELQSLLGARPVDAASIGEVLDLVKDGPAVQQALDVARDHNARAEQALGALDQNATVLGLTKLPGAYLGWAIENRAPDLAVPA